MYYVQIFYRYSAKPNCECGPTALAAAEAAVQQQSCHTEPHQYRIIPATDIYIWIICTKCSQRCENFNICHEFLQNLKKDSLYLWTKTKSDFNKKLGTLTGSQYFSAFSANKEGHWCHSPYDLSPCQPLQSGYKSL